MVPTISFNGEGREMTISDYGLICGPVGTQHHIWATFVDDTAAKIQREATARILQPTGRSSAEWRCMQSYHAVTLRTVACTVHIALASLKPGKGMALHLHTSRHQCHWMGRLYCHRW